LNPRPRAEPCGPALGDDHPAVAVVGRLIVSRFQALLELDRAHIDELDNDVKPRRLKQRLAAALYAKMVDVRRLADAAFGRLASAGCYFTFAFKRPCARRRNRYHLLRATGRSVLSMPNLRRLSYARKPP